MIDHIGVKVASYEASKAFYAKALAPLGYTLQMEFGKAGGFGENGKPSLWIGEDDFSFWGAHHKTSAAPAHIALVAKDRAAVDAFHAAAVAAGGKDFRAPRVRPIYHPTYYR